MIRTIVFIAVLSIAVSEQGFGQRINDTIPNHWNLTYSPSALVNTFVGIQFGVERYFSGAGGVELEGAYIVPTLGTYALSKSGFRAKLGFKLKTRTSLVTLFTFYYRRTVHDHDDRVARFDFAYFERYSFKKTKTLFGPTFGLGTVQSFSDRLSFEGGVNIGLGRYVVRNIGLPEDAEEVEFNFFGYQDPGSYIYPIIGLSLKLKYRLGVLSELEPGSSRNRPD